MNASVLKLVQKAKAASRTMALLKSQEKRKLLETAARLLIKSETEIVRANQKDLAAGRKAGLSAALLDRLMLNSNRIAGMAQALKEIAAQTDPIGEVIRTWKTDEGVTLRLVRVPLGVVAMVYESRPNVTIEAAALCIQSGNAVILRGGKEAKFSNTMLANILHRALKMQKLPEDAVSLLPSGERQNIYELARMNGLVDLLIARGSEKMVHTISEAATVPVLGHGKGLCHVYVDQQAKMAMAESIILNAKVQRPGVCNAMETLLVHQKAAQQLLPALAKKLIAQGVQLRGDAAARKLVPQMQPATDQDWKTEYLDLTLSIKVVPSLNAAIDHIARYGSGHTEAIVTENSAHAAEFFRRVDAACVLHNASTRLHDGSVFKLGAEIGISTAKLHARGTMGARELTTTQYQGSGSGQIRRG